MPRRAEYIRVLAWELNRISSHALFIGWLALDLGGLTPILWGFAERDEIVEMLAALTGQKLLFNYLRIGGVNGDLNHEFLSRLGDWMSHAAKHIEDETRLLNENEIFVARTRGLGVLDRETALRLCLSGPPLRATGVPYDVRRAHPTASIRSSSSRSRRGSRATRTRATCCTSTRSSRASTSSTRCCTRSRTAPSWPRSRACCACRRGGPSSPSRARAASTPATA